ncbi:MAG: hypothetical protein DME04_09885 [Candidatus Rokuibacteriota bacterium]|nr:MAG: hypothetical protein DME04_09885 [Candidatus Rokubacteria bacterium]
MTPPPLLLGAALLFWGWHTGFLLVALPVALLLEAARAVEWRLELSIADFNRVADLCALLIVVSGIYLFSTAGSARGAGGPRAITLLFQWLPLLLFPLIAGQRYSAAGRAPLTAFFWALRRQAARDPQARPATADLGYVYFALCVLSASAANRRTIDFYVGLCALAAWALWPWRSRRYSPLWWAPLLVLAAGVGYVGHIALHNLQRAVEQTVFDFVFNTGTGDTDPFRSTTSLGHLGNLKLSERTLLRVEPGGGVGVPLLLREASYDVYNAPGWFASGAGFTSVPPEADGETWKFVHGPSSGSQVTVAAYLNRGRGVLALPPGAFEIDRLAVVGVHRNRLGAVKVEEGLGLVTYTALFGPRGPLDGPPGDTDLGVPSREAPIVHRIAQELAFEGKSPAERLASIEAYFQRGFRYSTWKGRRESAETAIEEFLVRSRAGHCEYFATATVLLLRAAGVPARYAVGYSVQEWSPLERRYIVRARHSHSWALAFVHGGWRDVDTTPAVWADAERDQGSPFELLHDLWSWAVFVFSRWRWGGDEGSVGRYAGWLLVPLVLLLAWRLYSRRRVGHGGAASAAAAGAIARPGQDSEYYLIERRLESEGRGRRPWEPASAWIQRIHAGELRPIVELHYRYRFDPAGLDPIARVALKAGAEAWLREHPVAEATR